MNFSVSPADRRQRFVIEPWLVGLARTFLAGKKKCIRSCAIAFLFAVAQMVPLTHVVAQETTISGTVTAGDDQVRSPV